MNTSGTQVFATVRPGSTEDTYAVAFSNEIKGGFHSVASIADRDAIPSERLQEGMLVNVIADRVVYMLDGGIWRFYSTTNNYFQTAAHVDGYLDVSVGGVRKITIARDIQLRHGTLPAGTSGTILVKQDALGSRRVFLQTGDLGTLTMNPIPNGTTRLDWISDGEDVFWTSQMLDVTEEIHPPGAVSDLHYVFIDSTSVKLEWTAPSGNGTRIDVAPTRYAIYHSQAPLTADNFNKATKVIAKMTPGLPGTIETTVLNNLKADTVQYIAIVPETLFFLLRQAPLSNVIELRTKAAILPEGSSTYLKVRPDQIQMFMHPYKLDAENNALTEGNMADGDIVVENGMPTAGSNLGSIMSLQYYVTMQWAQYTPIQIIIDMERVCRIDYLAIWRLLTPVTEIYTSLTGDDWVHANTMQNDFPVSANKWFRYDFPAQARQCRYIKLALSYTYDISEIAIFGSEISVSAIPNGKRLKLQLPRKRFELATGTNSFLNENPLDYGKFGKVIRFYNNMDWMVSIANQTPDKTYTLDSTKPVPYQFSTSRLWDFDEKLKEVHDLGLEALWSHQKIAEFLVMPEHKTKNLRINYWALDTAQVPSAVNKEDPMSYRFIAQYFFQIAARYGSNANIDNSLLRLDPAEPIRKGLGYLKYLEYYNEPDATWHDEQGFYSPYMMAAFMSAAYDGHKGLLGPGFGAKNADPNMIMVFPGLADNNIGYLTFMLQWWDSHRGEGDYPFDVYNWHFYSNLRRGQTTKNELPEIGIPPEPGEMQEICEQVSELRNRRFPEKEIWLTEFGYDEHPASPQGAKQIKDRVIGLVKADWLMRSFIIGAASNVDVLVQFMYRAAGSWLAEVIASGFSSKFASSGYVDLLGTEEDRYHDKDGNPIDPRLPTYFYIGALVKELEGMKVSHYIKDKFGTQVDDILVNPEDSVYAVAFVPDVGVAKSPCIVLWHATDTDKKSEIQIKTDAVTSIKLSTYRGIETTKGLVPFQTQVPTAIVDGSYRAATLEIGETPVILWSSRIGSRKVQTPSNLEVTAISTDALRLTWWDKNPEDFKTQVYVASDASAEFSLIAEDFFPDCGYTVGNLTPATSRWFMLRLISLDGTRVSEFTSVIAGTTNQSVVGPTNFRKLSANVNRLTIAWDFVEADESKILGFEVYKSTSPTGTYVLLSTVSKTTRQLSDIGLRENTAYYYKVRSIAALGNSDLSGTLAATTTEAQVQPPVIIYKNSTYFGDKIFLWFNIPIKNSAAAESHFTVYEEGAEVPVKTISGFQIDQSSQRLAVVLSTPIENKNHKVYVGYDGKANLSTIFDVKMEAFEDEQVINLKDDASLVVNRISLSFNGWNGETFESQYSPTLGEYFNELPSGPPKLDIGANYNKLNLINMSGAETTIAATLPMIQSGSVTYKTDASVQPGFTPMLTLADFPAKVASKGHQNAYTFNIQRTAFLNLNPANKYTVKALVSAGSWITQDHYAVGTVNGQSSTAQTILATGNDGSRLMEWKNLAPLNLALAVGATNTPQYLNLPKLIVDVTAQENGKAFVLCGLYLEEIVEYIPVL